MIKRYAVIGNPVEHSKSPQIHQAFANQFGIQLEYSKKLADIAEDGFERMVHQLIAEGYSGANVTVPFKFKAFALCDNVSDYVKSASAVNTLIFDGKMIKGDNSDGVGLTQDIQHNLNISLRNQRVLLLGAGGAATGVLLPLAMGEPASITIVNRNLNKAQDLIGSIKKSAAYTQKQLPLAACDFESLHNQTFDIVINATSTGLIEAALPVPNTIFGHGCLAYDMMYGRETPFMRQAKEAGARVADGLGMLVEQAAYAFWLWHGVKPDTAPVIKLLRA